ncbi:MAG: 4'-phosphopantetheinyl transferase superfamily protein [Polyangiaceae bacterium]|nr:4'-phosphopantetheinyl transferase superfamily protein [Polyangiaceae bacterium]
MPSALPNPPLFPAFVAQHTIAFDPDTSAPLADQFPGIASPLAGGRAVPKRQAEFLAGRFCAREAMRTCAPHLAEADVGIGPGREPLWPPGIVGAITHTHGIASAAVARRQDTRGVGLDAERIMTGDSAESVLESIATRDEIAAIAAATGWSVAVALTAVFSAKETLYKALYPEVQRYFDFRDAWLEAFESRDASFHARLVTALSPSLPAGYALTGRFSQSGDFVFTGIAL